MKKLFAYIIFGVFCCNMFSCNKEEPLPSEPKQKPINVKIDENQETYTFNISIDPK